MPLIERSEFANLMDYFLANLPYYRCLLLVHSEIAHLKAVSQQITEQNGWPVLSIGSVLSQRLLSVSPQRRPFMAPRVFNQMIQENKPGPLVCNEIDLLFEPTLALDPLRLLREAGRHTTLIVFWPGTYSDGTLTYAVPGHGHYQAFAEPGLCNYCIIPL